MTGTLHQSLLLVPDIDASTAFYRDVVGLAPVAVEEGNAPAPAAVRTAAARPARERRRRW